MGFIVNGINVFFYHNTSIKDITFEDLVKVYTRDKIAHIFSRETSSMVNIEKSLKVLSKEKLDQIIAIKLDKKLTYEKFRNMTRKLDIESCIFMLFKEVDESITKRYFNENGSYSRQNMNKDLIITDKENQLLISESQTSFMLFPKYNYRCYIIKTRNSCMKNTRTIVGEIWTNKLYEILWWDNIHEKYEYTYAKSINKENALRIAHIEQKHKSNRIDPRSVISELSLSDFLTYHQVLEKYGEKHEENGDI